MKLLSPKEIKNKRNIEIEKQARDVSEITGLLKAKRREMSDLEDNFNKLQELLAKKHSDIIEKNKNEISILKTEIKELNKKRLEALKPIVDELDKLNAEKVELNVKKLEIIEEKNLLIEQEADIRIQVKTLLYEKNEFDKISSSLDKKIKEHQDLYEKITLENNNLEKEKKSFENIKEKEFSKIDKLKFELKTKISSYNKLQKELNLEFDNIKKEQEHLQSQRETIKSALKLAEKKGIKI